MSFSSNVKTELCQARIEGSNAKNALLGGIIFGIGREESGELRIATESSDVIKLSLKLIKTMESKVVFRGGDNSPFSKKKIYELAFSPSAAFYRHIRGDGIAAGGEAFPFESSLGFFLRGVFLGVGSMSDPNKAYHLEMVLKDREDAERIAAILRSHYGLNAKTVLRKKSHVCYLKEAENISDFLTIVGSVSSLLNYENIRAYKQIMNKINRAVNCDTANINKATDAAIVQLNAIRLLEEKDLLRGLGEKCMEIAALRVENQELSLAELGQLAYPPISKSGCNHRMKKILEEAARVREGDGNPPEAD